MRSQHIPEPRLHNRGYQRIRVGGGESVYARQTRQPAGRQADKRYKSILTVWGLAVAGTPTISKLRQTKKSKSLKPTQHSPDTNQICVADLLCTALVSVKEKIWHWYLLRRVAVCLEPCASLPGIEFGVQSLRQFARTKATTVM